MKKEMLQYLKSERLMSLATVSADTPFACPVFYAVDNNLNFYFVSEKESSHCKNITKNPKVACTIADTNQKSKGKKSGMQIQGIASVVSDKKELRTACSLWNKANPGIEKFINVKSLTDGEERMYKITPILIKYMNEKLYGHFGNRVMDLR